MVDLGDDELNEKLKRLKKQKIPTEEEIRKEEKELEQKEKEFKKKFLRSSKK